MVQVQVILTCYNRKDFTIRCIQSLQTKNHHAEMHYVVVDDASTDGTSEALHNMPYSIEIIKGNGQLFWNGGMHKGLSTILETKSECEYVLLVNDDVVFFDGCIDQMIEQSQREGNAVIVGTTTDTNGETSYGGVRYTSRVRIKYVILEPADTPECDTFNANCVLIPYNVVKEVGNMDPFYKHAMGDFDYGMMIKRKGFKIHHTAFYVGECNNNAAEGTWTDPSLSRRERLRLKESAKGLPVRDWFHFANKNFGLFTAIYHSITPYVKILIRK